MKYNTKLIIILVITIVTLVNLFFSLKTLSVTNKKIVSPTNPISKSKSEDSIYDDNNEEVPYSSQK